MAAKRTAKDYLSNATPRSRARGLAKVEPETYEAAVQWLQARLARTSSITFRQFYDDYLVGVLGTQYSHRGVLEHLKTHHGDEYRKLG